MDANGIKDVLVDIGMRRSDLNVVHGWVSTKCPLAPWTHEKRRDGSPSAGVSISDAPIFNCFTCGNTRPLHSLVSMIAEYSGDDYDDLIEELEESAYLGPKEMADWDQMKDRATEELLMPLHEGMYMDLYDSAAGHPYLRERGISDETARKLELLYDPADPVDAEMGTANVGRILFPQRGPNGELYGFSGRDVTGRSPVKARDYHGLKKALCVLGSHLVTANNPDELFICEGLFDYANMHEQGYHGCAVMHSNLTEAQAQIFRDLGKPAYLFYDDDKAGKKGVEAASKLLIEYIPLMRVRYPEIWVPDESDAEGGHYVTDPGELLREDIQWMIEDAQPVLPEVRQKWRRR